MLHVIRRPPKAAAGTGGRINGTRTICQGSKLCSHSGRTYRQFIGLMTFQDREHHESETMEFDVIRRTETFQGFIVHATPPWLEPCPSAPSLFCICRTVLSRAQHTIVR
jgi:hypothetical protein